MNCQSCGKRCSNLWNLKQHMATHQQYGDGIKPLDFEQNDEVDSFDIDKDETDIEVDSDSISLKDSSNMSDNESNMESESESIASNAERENFWDDLIKEAMVELQDEYSMKRNGYMDGGMSVKDATIKAQNKMRPKIRSMIKKKFLYLVQKNYQMQFDNYCRQFESAKLKLDEYMPTDYFSENDEDDIDTWPEAVEKKRYLFNLICPDYTEKDYDALLKRSINDEKSI